MNTSKPVKFRNIYIYIYKDFQEEGQLKYTALRSMVDEDIIPLGYYELYACVYGYIAWIMVI